MNYNKLIAQIGNTHLVLQKSAVKAVNTHITLRNWLIGFYIVEFEQKGEDRAKYGSKLLQKMAISLKAKNIKTNERDLRNIRSFYNVYTHFIDFLPFLPLYTSLPKSIMPIRGSATPESDVAMPGSLTQELQRIEFQEDEKYYSQIFTQISYTHFVELIKIKEVTKRKLYKLLASIYCNYLVKKN